MRQREALEQMGEWLDEIKREALYYLEQGTDCFTVYAGPWTLTFDNIKESEVKE